MTELRPDVPPELDLAIRMALERAPEDRYETALEFAQALEAGQHGHATEATQRMAATAYGDLDATRAIETTAATRAMPRTRMAPAAPAPTPTRAAATAAPVDQRRADRNRRLGRFFALVAALLAVLIVGLVLLSAEGGGSGAEPVNRNNVQEQVDGIQQFLRENTRR